jgi:hypothetical protein
MKIKISSQWPYQILFFIAVGVSYIDNYEFSLSIWLLILIATVKKFYSKSFITFLSFFSAILIIGTFRSFFYDHQLYNIVRDISYFIKPIVGLLIGYQCFRSDSVNFFKTILYCAAIIATIHCFVLLISFIRYPIPNIHRIRYFGGYFSDFETFALLILVFRKKLNIYLSTRKFWLLFTLITTSLILYFARTNMIQFFIIACGMFGLFQLTPKKIIGFLVLVIIGGITYKIIYDLDPKRNGEGLDAFLYKIKNAPREIYDPGVKNDNSPRFHDNFRSYETKVTVKQMSENNDFGIWLGNGFGAIVDYHVQIHTTDGNNVRFAPILHNGYTTIFLKTGIIGLIIYISAMIYLSTIFTKTTNVYLNNIKLLINSTGIFLFLSTLVFLGFYLKLDNKSLFVGGIIAYYEIMRKKQHINKTNESAL